VIVSIGPVAREPIESMVELLDRAQQGLWATAAVVLAGGMVLAFQENTHRVHMRNSMEKASNAVSAETRFDASKLAALVEIVRALTHPLHTVFQTSRAAAVLIVAGVLGIAAALVPILGTALLANHCKPHFPPPAPAVVASPSAGSGGSPGGDTTGGDTTGGDTTGGDTTGGDTTGGDAVAPQEIPWPQPSPVFAPGCGDEG
jgi:hypothetical protein